MSDNLPGFTCPDIDRVLKIIRRHVEGADRAAAVETLEQLREDNRLLREGYAQAKEDLRNALRHR